MSDIANGGPAFPLPAHKKEFGPGLQPLIVDAEYGMTLRDYFAAKAMQGFISGTMANGAIFNGESDTNLICRMAYVAADAMLEARK